MDALTCLLTLRAVRHYREIPIPDTVLHDILEAGRWCGSSRNSQPWQFVVIRDRATLQQLARLGSYAAHVAGASLAIALVMEGEGRGASFDAGRVAQNLMLAAHAHGVGSCIASISPEENERAALRLLEVPEGYSLRIVIAFGYPAPRAQDRTIAGQPRERVLVMIGRKPRSELVHYERFGQRSPPA